MGKFSHIVTAIALLVATGAATSAQEQTREKIIFMPQWTPQAQFAGFYVAKEKGFYDYEGIDVEIKHKSTYSTEPVMDLMQKGNVQICGMQLIGSLIAAGNGTPIVNVMQLTQKTGLRCVTHKSVTDPQDLNGMTIGKWKTGFSELVEMLASDYDLNINWVPVTNGINLFVFGAVDATLCYSYNEFIQLELAMGTIPEDHIIKFLNYSVSFPEDGLYVTASYYKKHKEAVDKFVKASRRGWIYAAEHPEEAVKISEKITEKANILTNHTLQSRMLREYLELMSNPASGKIDFAPIGKKAFNSLAESLIRQNKIPLKPNYEDFVK